MFKKVSNKQKTIVFDFDGTLAKFTYHKDSLPNYDEQIDLLTRKENKSIYIKLRPKLQEVLRELKKNFELIMFTSTNTSFCSALIKKTLETNEQFFDYKLYNDACMYFPGAKGYVKNLNILLEGRSLQDIVIIDHQAQNYNQHILNGIPLIEYNGDENDTVLLSLQDFLNKNILYADDVQTVIQQQILDAFLDQSTDQNQQQNPIQHRSQFSKIVIHQCNQEQINL